MKQIGGLLTAVLVMMLTAGAAHARTVLTYDQLMTGTYPKTVDYKAYTPDPGSTWASNLFEGQLQISGTPSSTVVFQDPTYVTPAVLAAAKTLPTDFNYYFVRIPGSGAMIPQLRGPIANSNRNTLWEFIVNPGWAWDETGDHGYTRAVIPFSLKEKNQDCALNGMLMFLFKEDGSTSRTAMQITSESCLYLKMDLWGLLSATYTPRPIPKRSEVVTAYDDEKAHLLPVSPMSQLATDFPAIGVIPSNFAIGNPSGNTLYGVTVFDSKVWSYRNYRSDCQTRTGAYPYCDVLNLPSYSVAKSAFAGIALMRLQAIFPGVKDELISSWVPQCATPTWSGATPVTFENALDMATGNFYSNVFEQDEFSLYTAQHFFQRSTHADKINFGCGTYLRKATPGTTFVYQTSATYVLVTAMNNYLKSKRGPSADIYDLLVNDIFKPLGMSQSSWVTRRTYDAVAEPFGGYGLTFYPNDYALLALFLKDGTIWDKDHKKGTMVLDFKMQAAALQHDFADRGLPVADPGSPPGTVQYNKSVWAKNVQNNLQCDRETWVPFMSGMGPISIVMFPNNVTYYNFANDGRAASYDWTPPAIEANKFFNYCGGWNTGDPLKMGGK